ncbi:MAG: cyclodeaminase/cyclohydrolase family protein [Gaiellaceae bacterium]
MTEEFLPLRLEELLDRLAADEPVPGSGSAAALVLAMAASLVAKAARRSSEWPEAGGAAAQALSLRKRAVELAGEDARAYAEALERLGRREGADHLLAGALEQAADVPLRIARAGADVAALAAEVCERCDQAVRADVIGAATLAAGAAQAAARLIETNLGTAEDDPRLLEANAHAEAALRSAHEP